MKSCVKISVIALFAILALSFVPSALADQIEPGTVLYLSGIDRHTGSPRIIDITSPICSTWQEIHPNYNMWIHLWSWEDTDHSDDLTASDELPIMDHVSGGTTPSHWVGDLYSYHVERVTVTIHFTWKTTPPGFDPMETVHAEPAEDLPNTEHLPDPVGTMWHMIHPGFSKPFQIASWEDTDHSGTFNPSDQFGLLLDGTAYWAHQDAVSTDIHVKMIEIVSIHHHPHPPGVTEFSLVAALGLGFIATTVFLWWKRRPPKVSTI